MPFEAAVLDETGEVWLSSTGWRGEVIDHRLTPEVRAALWQSVHSVAAGHCPAAAFEHWLGGDDGGWLHLRAARCRLAGRDATFVCVLDSTSTLSLSADLLGQAHIGYWLADADWSIANVCERFARLLGYVPSAMLGRHAMEFAAPVERDLGVLQVQQRFGRPTDFLGARLQRRDGSLIELAFASTPLLDAAGRVGGLASAVAELRIPGADGTAATTPHRAIAAISSASRRAMEAANERQAVCRALEAVGQALEVDRTYLFEVLPATDGGAAVTLRGEWLAPGVAPRPEAATFPTPTPTGQPYDGLALLAEGHLVAGIAEDFGEPFRSMLRHNGVRSLVMAPVLVDGRFYGFVGASDLHNGRDWPASEQSAVRALGTIIGAAISQHRLAAERDKTLTRLQLVLSRMPMACLTTDLDWRCTFFNPAAESMFGWREEEMLGQSLLGRITPVEVTEHLNGIADRMRRGTPIALSVNDNMTAHGRRLICEWQNVPLREPGGEVTGILCMAQDVTERRLAMDREREAEARFQALAAASAQGVVALDSTACVTIWNQAAESITGWPAADVLGRPVPADLSLASEAMQKSIANVLAGASLDHVTEQTRRRDGQPIRLAVRGTPLRDAQGALAGGLFVFADAQATDRLRQEATVLHTMYHAVVDTWEQPVCHFDTELRMIDANEAAARLFGRPLAELRGLNALDVVPMDRHQDAMMALSRALTNDGYAVQAGPHVRPDGTVAYCEWTVRALHDADGNIASFQTVGRLLDGPPE